MIARIWRGAVARADGDAYEAYIEETGFAAYGETPATAARGCCAATTGELTEFVTYSLWESLEAVKAFAGEEYDVAVYYPEDERFLVEREDTVLHYDVAREIPPPA